MAANRPPLIREPKMSSAEGEPLDDYGKWVVVWKKQPDGTWAHIIDIFNSDVPLSSAPAP